MTEPKKQRPFTIIDSKAEDASFRTDDDVLAALSSSDSIGEAASKLAEAREATEDHYERRLKHDEAHITMLAVDRLVESPTNPRSTFRGLEDLAESIKKVGLLQPLMVRSLLSQDGSTPLSEERFEIVFGHRRFRAAQLAGMRFVPADVRALTDVQVLEAQLVENVQRDDIHPLEEAEAYQRLVDTAGYTVEMLAAKVGRTRSWVYQRLKLLSLCTEARKAFLDGKLPLSVAVPLARVPTAKLQVKAVERICGDEPWTARNAIEWLQNEFCVSLKSAPFDRKDDMLVEGAPACTACPKRSGCGTPGLFDDLSSQDICTDTTCFTAKSRATWDAKAEKFAKQGAEVLSLSEGKRLFREGVLQHGTEYVEVDQPVHEDSRRRTWSELLDKKEPRVVVAPDASMRPHRLYLASDATAAAAELGLPWAQTKAKRAEARKPEATAEESRQREVRERVATDVLVAAGTAIRSAAKVPNMAYLLLATAVEGTTGSQRPAARAYLEKLKVTDFSRWVSRAEPQAMLGYLFVVLVDEWCGHTHTGFEPGLEATAKAFGLDLKAMVGAAATKENDPKKKAADAAEALFTPKSKKAK